jgi:hypothetical protein
VGHFEDTLILEELQAVPKRWTNKELPGRRADSTTMRHHRVRIESGEDVRSPSETGWGSSNAEAMPTYVLRREINACAAILTE